MGLECGKTLTVVYPSTIRHMSTGLSDEFARDAAKRTQWKAFLDKSRLDAPTLAQVIADIRRFVAKPLQLARQKQALP